MTDNEIIKALECCTNNNALDNCDTCPLCDYGNCRDALIEYCSNTINRQNAEIERLKAENEGYKHVDAILHTAIDELTAKIKSEFIREFAERLKERRGRNFPFTEAVSIFDINSFVREMTEGGQCQDT